MDIEFTVKTSLEVAALVARFLRQWKQDSAAEQVETILRRADANYDSLIATAEAELAKLPPNQ